jgi:zinc transporter ZupT
MVALETLEGIGGPPLIIRGSIATSNTPASTYLSMPRNRSNFSTYQLLNICALSAIGEQVGLSFSYLYMSGSGCQSLYVTGFLVAA